MQETQETSLGREDPVEEEMAIHASILAWRIPWTEEQLEQLSTHDLRVDNLIFPHFCMLTVLLKEKSLFLIITN